MKRLDAGLNVKFELLSILLALVVKRIVLLPPKPFKPVPPDPVESGVASVNAPAVENDDVAVAPK